MLMLKKQFWKNLDQHDNGNSPLEALSAKPFSLSSSHLGYRLIKPRLSSEVINEVVGGKLSSTFR